LTLDKIGTRIFDILKRKVAEGVDVKVIYDSVGSMGMKWAKKAEIRATGIQFECFLRIYFPLFSSRSNYRNHRKIVVVDGKVGFTGGINIADNYLEETKKFGVWRDTFVRIEGNAVYALDAIFCADWYFITKEKIAANMDSYLETQSTGNLTQIISGCPDSDWKVILQFYFSAISTAKKSVYITTPYFIPNDEVICAIKLAGLRGLDVRLLLPEKSDSRVTKWCSESFLGELLLAGLKIYKYQPGFVHSKVLIVDGILSSVGTANMDYRSLETNFEVNAVFYDTKIAQDLTDSFLDDLENSTILTYDAWKNRPWYYKLVSSVSRLLAPAI
jgi:cardiolipin synthase